MKLSELIITMAVFLSPVTVLGVCFVIFGSRRRGEIGAMIGGLAALIGFFLFVAATFISLQGM